MRASFERHPALGAGLAAATAAILVALPSLLNGFTYDDVWIIQRNDIVHHLAPLGRLLASSYWPAARGAAMWRPAGLFAFALQWAVSGGTPLLFHVVNVLLAGVVAFLVGVFGAELFGGRVGLVGGLLFAVHPVHVEVTANVVGQTELLAAVGYLTALLAVWHRSGLERRRSRVSLALVAALTAALGVASKEHAVTLPAAVVLVWWMRAHRDGARLRDVARREWAALVAILIPLGVYLVLRAGVTGGVAATGGVATSLVHTSPLVRFVIMLPVSLRWLALLFLPIHLSADYSPRYLVGNPSFGAIHLAALILWIAILGGAWRVRRKAPAVAFGVAWFVVTISVVSGVVVPLEVLLAERFLFLPSVGWAIAIGGLWHRRAAFAFLIAGVLLAGRSVMRTPVWRSNAILFPQMIHDAPGSYRGHWALGAFAFERGDSVTGEREMRLAIRLNPADTRVSEDLGRIYAATGRYAPAIPLLSRAVAADSSRVSTALTLALSLARSGRARDGEQVLDAFIRRGHASEGLRVVQAEVLRRAGKPDSALMILHGVLARKPDLWRLRLMAAETAVLAGKCDVAHAELDTARQTAPAGAADSLADRLANGKGPCK